MLQIQIPKDIREYETKFIGPFTARQCICIVIAAVIEYVGSNIIKSIAEIPISSYIPPLIIAAIPLILGFGDVVFHMKPEVYFKEVFLRSLKYPKVRPYKTHNFIDVQIREAKKELEMQEAKEGKGSKTKRSGDATDKSAKNKARKKQDKNIPPELTAYS